MVVAVGRYLRKISEISKKYLEVTGDNLTLTTVLVAPKVFPLFSAKIKCNRKAEKLLSATSTVPHT